MFRRPEKKDKNDRNESRDAQKRKRSLRICIHTSLQIFVSYKLLVEQRNENKTKQEKKTVRSKISQF